MTIKVLMIVEDDPDMRLLVRMTLSTDPRLEIAGEAATAEEAIALAHTAEPGLIVLDHSLDGELTGLVAAPLLKQAAPAAKIILFSAFDLAVEASAEPAIDAFLSKTDIAKLLPTAQALLGLDG